MSAALIPVCAAVALAYAVQLRSPLRLNGDSIEYLWVAAAIADGRPYVTKSYVAPFPFGYPALVAALDRHGWRGSAVLVGVNYLFLVMGVAAAYLMFRRHFALPAPWAGGLCVLALLSWVCIKHVTLPMSDLSYFGASMVCVFAATAAQSARGVRRLAALAIAAGAAWASVRLRVLGVTLIPAVLWSAALPRGWRAESLRSRWSIALPAALAVAAAGAGTIWLFPRTEYYRRLADEVARSDGRRVAASILEYRLSELGEIGLNVPPSMAPEWLSLVLPIAGAMVLGGVLRGMWHRGTIAAPEVYVAGLLVVLFVWPFPEARLWLPVLPLMMGYIAGVVRAAALSALARYALALCVWVYLVAGAAALAYSSYVSLSGSRFADVYAGGSMRRAYRTAYGSATPEEMDDLTAKAVYVLRRHQRAAPGGG